MKRFAFAMKLKGEEVIPEYEKLHKEVGKDVIDAHKRSGFNNYSIYRMGLTLFAYFESEEPEKCFEKLSTEPIMKDWWAKTNPLMETEENKPLFIPLPEVFHMD
ncbi:MAG: L-rhamnose mutarotase [Candidatus Hydrogenedentes bacterium]|nr:L-rhamnose mutarotase [Candidatus Hydrogenedentota bacterium]